MSGVLRRILPNQHSVQRFHAAVGITRLSSPVFTSIGRSCIVSRFGTSSNMSSEITPVVTTNATTPVGPYKELEPDKRLHGYVAVKIPGLIFVSGQMPADPQGNLVGGSIGNQTAAVCRNLQAIVEAAGSSMSKVVKVNVFLDDMANFAEMNAEYEKWFTHKPARSTVAVKQLPKNIPVEIEVIALP